MLGRLFGRGGGDEGLTVEAAREAALADRLILVDIRTPQEWAQTGIGDVAEPLDLMDPGFLDGIAAIAERAGPREVALICRSGARSAQAARALADRGIAVRDVPEGMIGWLGKGLPVRAAG